MTPERYLEFAAVEIAQSTQDALLLTDDDATLETLLDASYLLAFSIGAIVAGLSLLRVPLPAPHSGIRPRRPTAADSYTSAAQVRLERQGAAFKLKDAKALEQIKAQASTAATALKTARASQGLLKIGAETRAGSYAARWGAQHGAAAQGARAAVSVAGQPSQALKTWFRSFPRKEARPNHDALNGVTIPVSERFKLFTPRYGLLEVLFPYDGDAPWSEWIFCGHSVRYSSPDGAEVTVWQGDEPRRPAAPADAQPGTRAPRGEPLEPFGTVSPAAQNQTSKALQVVNSVHGGATLEALPVKMRRLPQGNLGGYQIQSDGMPLEFVFNSTRALKVETVVHEIAHALDHQVIGETRVFASLASDLLGSTEALEVMSEIRASQTFRTVSGYSAGQIVLGRVLQPGAISYHQDPREWFARAYTQYIGLRSGDAELLAFIGRSRPSPGRALVYPEAWPDQEFKPILSAMERLLVRKGWMR